MSFWKSIISSALSLERSASQNEPHSTTRSHNLAVELVDAHSIPFRFSNTEHASKFSMHLAQIAHKSEVFFSPTIGKVSQHLGILAIIQPRVLHLATRLYTSASELADASLNFFQVLQH